MSTLDKLYAMERQEAIGLLRDSYGTFCSAIEEVQRTQPLPPVAPRDDSSTESVLSQAAALLRRDGYVKLPGLLNNDAALSEGRELAEKLKAVCDQVPLDDPRTIDGMLNEEIGGRIWARRMAAHYRAGIHPDRLPAGIRDLTHNPMLSSIIERASGPGDHVKSTLTVVDHMVPTDEYEQQWWHVDLVSDQFKAMVLLDHVGPDTGPMQLIPGTHVFEGKRRMIDFAMYAETFVFSEIPHNIYGPMREQVVKVTGKPGDVFIFNTRAYHAIGRPKAGRRMTMTIYFSQVQTPLNRFLNDFHPGYPV